MALELPLLHAKRRLESAPCGPPCPPPYTRSASRERPRAVTQLTLYLRCVTPTTVQIAFHLDLLIWLRYAICCDMFTRYLILPSDPPMYMRDLRSVAALSDTIPWRASYDLFCTVIRSYPTLADLPSYLLQTPSAIGH